MKNWMVTKRNVEFTGITCFILRRELLEYVCYWREKAMATHSSTLVWKIPWAEEPHRLLHGVLLFKSNGVTRHQTCLSNFTFTLHFHALEKEMATHSSVLAWRIPGTGEPGGLDTTEVT